MEGSHATYAFEKVDSVLATISESMTILIDECGPNAADWGATVRKSLELDEFYCYSLVGTWQATLYGQGKRPRWGIRSGLPADRARTGVLKVWHLAVIARVGVKFKLRCVSLPALLLDSVFENPLGPWFFPSGIEAGFERRLLALSHPGGLKVHDDVCCGSTEGITDEAKPTLIYNAMREGV